MATAEVHNIVILGGSFGGINVAHSVLKALPGLKKQTSKNYRVVMISNSSHFWWSVGAPRAMLKPYPQDIMDSFIPITKGFSQYPSSDFEFLFAEITTFDPATKTVSYKVKDEQEKISDTTSTLTYGTLVIATGSKGPSPLYSVHGSHIPTLEAYKEVHAQLPGAKSIMVIGGGSAGTETAGELGTLHGKTTSHPKEITILSGSDRLLSALRPAIGARAEEMLTKMGVQTIHNVRLDNSQKLSDGRTEVKLSNGETKIVDILLVATGRKPVSDIIPSSVPVDQNGCVVVDEYLRVPSQSSMYVTGDVASRSVGGIMFIRSATPIVAGNIVAELSGKGPGKEFKPITTKEMQIVPVGPSQGVGAIMGWWAPSFAVTMIKSKNLMFPKAMETVMGTA